MSRIVVARHLGAEEIDFGALVRRASPSFHDALEVHREPGLFVGVAAYWTEPEDEGSPALIDDRESGLLIAWDGRIDARDELIRELGAPVASSGAHLALRAFLRWGTRAPERMLGDFAMVVVDRRARNIFAARDRFGLRPLVHASHRDGRVLASDERLLSGLGLSRAPDVEALGRFIARVYVPIEETLYRDVRNVPSGGALEISDGGLSTRRYFDPDVEEHPLSDREHVDRVRQALVDAVADRSRGVRVIASDASGGVDSSTIVALLAERLRVADRQPPLLLHMRCRGMSCDESRYAQELSRHVGAPLFEAEGADTRFGPDGIAQLDIPDVWCGPSLVLHEEARRSGARVCFTGQGSDELQLRRWLVEDSLSAGAWVAAARFAGLFDAPLSGARWVGLLKAAARGVLPPVWLRRRHESLVAAQLPRWLGPLGRQHALAGALALDRFPDQHPDPSPNRRALHAELVFSAHTTLFAQDECAFARANGLELALPYCDLRVVMAFAGLPTRMRASFELPKPTLREIAREVLPPGLAWKYPGMDYAPFLHAGWRRASSEWIGLSGGDELAALGLVDSEKLRTAVEKGFKEGQLGWDLHPVLRAEAWLRRVKGGN